MIGRPIRRWSDNDRYFGPFTYARDHAGYRPIAVILGSSDGEEYLGCSLRVSGFGHTLIVRLPAVIRPFRERVDASNYWDAETVQRLGRDWYWSHDRREYGFSLSEGHLDVRLGRCTHDSSTEQRWGCFLPWTQWRHVRRTLYGLSGERFWDEPLGSWNGLGEDGWRKRYDAIKNAEDACPTCSFAFADFDGQELIAKTRVEEHEWRFGEGWFKWLSLFRRRKVVRSLNLEFSGETGRRKGSWKGGTIGSGISMLPGELHEAAFRRYCVEHSMTFLGESRTSVIA